MRKKSIRGVGKYQIEKAEKSIEVILKILSDEKEHRYKDLKKETKLNDPTLSKYLKRLVKLKVVKKRVDLQSGKYPYPVYYEAEPELVTYSEAKISTKEFSEQIEPMLLETKNPIFILNNIELRSKMIFLTTLSQIKKDKNITDSKLDFLLELFVWEPYKFLTWKLVEAFRKHKDDIPFEFDSEILIEKLSELKELLDKMDKEG